MPLSRRLTDVCAALLLVLLTGACGGARRLDVKPSDPSILYMGRILWADSLAPKLTWHGTTEKFNF